MKVFFTGLLLIFVGYLFAVGANKERSGEMLAVGSLVLGGILMVLAGGLLWIWGE